MDRLPVPPQLAGEPRLRRLVAPPSPGGSRPHKRAQTHHKVGQAPAATAAAAVATATLVRRPIWSRLPPDSGGGLRGVPATGRVVVDRRRHAADGGPVRADPLLLGPPAGDQRRDPPGGGGGGGLGVVGCEDRWEEGEAAVGGGCRLERGEEEGRRRRGVSLLASRGGVVVLVGEEDEEAVAEAGGADACALLGGVALALHSSIGEDEEEVEENLGEFRVRVRV